jgi:Ni,Fe-hydrogenase III large subunit
MIVSARQAKLGLGYAKSRGGFELAAGMQHSETVTMKNITVSVDSDVYHRARVRAAELRTSVSALVKSYLQKLAEEESEFDRLVRLQAETRKKVQARGCRFRAAERLSRDAVHDRNALR